MIIQMYIDAGLVAHDALHCHEVLVHPVEVTFFVPNVPIHLFLECFQFLNVKFAFSLGNSCCHFGIAADVHLLGIVGTAGKWWVNIDEVNKDTFVSEIGASRQALATNHQIVSFLARSSFIGLLCKNLLFQFHFIEGHASLYSLYNLVVVTIAQYSLGAYKIV